MAVVLKTTEPETVPGVRIPLPPPSAYARMSWETSYGAMALTDGDEIAPKRGARRRTNPSPSATLRSLERSRVAVGRQAIQGSVTPRQCRRSSLRPTHILRI
jgi:hypothetical protein